MPLKIRVKPEGKIFAGGAVLKNVGNRPVDLLVLSDSPVLREGYMMSLDKRDESDASNVYFLLQVLYLFKGKGQPLDHLVIETIRNFSKLYPHFSSDIDQVISLLEAGETFKALKIGHKLLAEQDKSSTAEAAALASKTINTAVTKSVPAAIHQSPTTREPLVAAQAF